MISYLKGIVAGIQNNSGNRYILTIEVNGLGYDLQIPARLAQQLPNTGGESKFLPITKFAKKCHYYMALVHQENEMCFATF